MSRKKKKKCGTREPEADRFRRAVEGRVNRIIKRIRQLGGCSERQSCVLTAEQIQQIAATLQAELAAAQERLMQSHRKAVPLSDGQYDRQPGFPTVVLPLPDGTSFRAVAVADEKYPAVNIYWDGGCADGFPVCFAEYNPEHAAGREVCIGAYRSDWDDVVYYRPYMAERESDERD